MSEIMGQAIKQWTDRHKSALLSEIMLRKLPD